MNHSVFFYKIPQVLYENVHEVYWKSERINCNNQQNFYSLDETVLLLNGIELLYLTKYKVTEKLE